MSESKIKLVVPKGLTINFPSVGAPMTVGAQGDEVVVTVRFTFRPRDNVMNLDFDVSTSGNSAPVTGLNENSPPDFSGYWRAPTSVIHDD